MSEKKPKQELEEEENPKEEPEDEPEDEPEKKAARKNKAGVSGEEPKEELEEEENPEEVPEEEPKKKKAETKMVGSDASAESSTKTRPSTEERSTFEQCRQKDHTSKVRCLRKLGHKERYMYTPKGKRQVRNVATYDHIRVFATTFSSKKEVDQFLHMYDSLSAESDDKVAEFDLPASNVKKSSAQGLCKGCNNVGDSHSECNNCGKGVLFLPFDDGESSSSVSTTTVDTEIESVVYQFSNIQLSGSKEKEDESAEPYLDDFENTQPWPEPVLMPFFGEGEK